MESAGWKSTYARWARIYCMALLLSPAVWAVLVRPPDGIQAVFTALVLTVALGWPWIAGCLLLGTVVVSRFSRGTADMIAILAALVVAIGTTQIRALAG